MINTHFLELPLSQTNFHGPKGVWAIEVLLYIANLCFYSRRRKARERQQKLMADFASKQKAFMEQAMETDGKL